MRKNIYSKIRRFMALIISMSMLLSMTTVASATEITDDNSNISELIPIAETSVSREEALETLGMTDEELGDAGLYVMDVPLRSYILNGTLVLESGNIEDIGETTFTGSYNGGTLMAFQASKVKFGVVWKWLNPDSRNKVIFDITLGNSYSAYEISISDSSGWGDGGTQSIQTDWCTISKDYTYHFRYRPRYSYTVESFPPIQIWAHVIVAAY